MNIVITSHARERMRKYKVPNELVISTVENPTSIMEGHDGRKIYQKKLNGHVLRVIVEGSKEIKASKVITVYEARSGRYD